MSCSSESGARNSKKWRHGYVVRLVVSLPSLLLFSLATLLDLYPSYRLSACVSVSRPMNVSDEFLYSLQQKGVMSYAPPPASDDEDEEGRVGGKKRKKRKKKWSREDKNDFEVEDCLVTVRSSLDALNGWICFVLITPHHHPLPPLLLPPTLPCPEQRSPQLHTLTLNST